MVWATEGAWPLLLKADPQGLTVLGAYNAGVIPESLHFTAVDRAGCVIGVTGDGSVLKVEADESRCPDRNGDGVVQTSHGWDDVLPFLAPDSWEDECILWHTILPPRAESVVISESIVLDGVVERAWIGHRGEQKYIELDAADGEPTGREVETPGLSPATAVVDGSGRVWTTFFGNPLLASFDPESPEEDLHMVPVPGGVSIVALDENDGLWVSGNNVYRFDRATEEFDAVFTQAEIDTGLAYGTGYMTPDGEGNLWQAPSTEEWVYRIDVETLEWERFELPFGLAFNVGVDFLRQLWIGVAAVENESPAYWVMDLETRELRPALVDCDDPCEGLPSPGDFTGLTRALVQDERGIWTRLVEACAPDESVRWSTLVAASSIPSGSSIDLMVRTGRDETELWEGPWLLAGPLADGESSIDLRPTLGEATSSHRLLAVQARLAAGRQAAAPRLHWVDVGWGCEPFVR